MNKKLFFHVCRFVLGIRDEVIQTECNIRKLRDEMRESKSPSILEKKYLSVREAAIYIDSTENFVKSLMKNHDINSYVSPYKGYSWVKRTDLDDLIERGIILSREK